MIEEKKVAVDERQRRPLPTSAAIAASELNKARAHADRQIQERTREER